MLKKIAILFMSCVFPLTGLSGCASKYGAQTTKVERYPQCYAPIKKLREEENSVPKHAAGGAAVGALLGAIIGGLTTGKLEGAVAGGVTGGLSGGALGYASAKQNQTKEQNARMASYLRDLDGDIADIDAVNASARHSLQCYDREFKLLLADYKSGRITKFELEKSYQEIKSGMNEAEHLLGVTLEHHQKLDAHYEAALADESRSADTPAAKHDAPSRASLDQMHSRVVSKKTKTSEAAAIKQQFATNGQEQQYLLDNIEMANG
ncbi:MAG: hypothetical protein LBR31_03845 [Desulfovibrio sp.]|jgi:uncharacterized protein YceK|nr:hypothetical protein [Desulfovibrio sp.]